MPNGFKYGTSNPSAVKFDAPIVDIESRYDFTSWNFNTEQQPSTGITVTKNKVVINKFRPNVPIITSNFTGTAADNTPTTTQLSAITKNSYARYTGLTANSSLWSTYCTKTNEVNSATVNIRGLYFAPYRTTNNAEINVGGSTWWMVAYDDGTTAVMLGDELTIRSEGNAGFGNISRTVDSVSYTKLLPSWSRFPENQDDHWQLGLGIYTGESAGDDGFITLQTPIVFEIENSLGVDVTTIEGYKVTLGEEILYGKQKTFANTLRAHGLSNKQVGTYQYPLGGGYHTIESSSIEGGQQYAYPIGALFFDSTARFTIKDTVGDASLYVNGFYYLESLGWYPNDPQIAVGNTVTVFGKIIGVSNDATSCSTQEHSGRLYDLNGTRSIIGNSIPAPGTAGTAGTLQQPYTVAAALARAKTLGNGVVDDTAHYITGKITSITSPYAPPYSEYDRLRFPVPTDLEGLITSGYPLKFWCTQYDDENHPGFWATVADIFEDFDIEDGKYCNHLFANSGGNLEELTFNFDLDDGYIDLGDMFNRSSLVETVNFNIKSGNLKVLHNTFLGCSSIQEVNFNTLVNISDFSGAFEGAALTIFPENVGAAVDWQSTLSEPTTMINYAADGAKLTTFGNIKDATAQAEEDKYFIAVLNPYCIGAFARSNITNVKYVLDMKFVSPLGGSICDYWNNIDDDSLRFNAVFNNQNTETLLLKNLNKGNWSFDNVVRTDAASHKACAGNLPNLDATSINYMLSNVFDLRWNTSKADRLENEFNSFNGWEVSGGTKRPTIWEYISSNSTLTKTLSTNGEMHVIITAVGCTFKVNGVAQSSGTRTLSLSAGSCTLSFEKDPNASTMIGTLTLDGEPDTDDAPKYRFMSELTSGLSSANIYLPSAAGSKISSAALATANARGWTVYVNGSVFTG